ncbi:MAG: YceI family protein [Acidimicrobiales bacterium]
MSTTINSSTISGYQAGVWNIDPVHSEVSFSVRHMMVSKVRGRFGTFEGQIVTATDPAQSSVTATVDLSSIDTNDANRDGHLRSADFFDVDTHPKMTFQSTSVAAGRDGYVVTGDLTLHGVTKSVQLNVEVNGFGPDPFGGVRAGFTATTEISRKEFGIEFNMPLPDGVGVVVGDKVQVTIEAEAVLQPPAGAAAAGAPAAEEPAAS